MMCLKKILIATLQMTAVICTTNIVIGYLDTRSDENKTYHIVSTLKSDRIASNFSTDHANDVPCDICLAAAHTTEKGNSGFSVSNIINRVTIHEQFTGVSEKGLPILEYTRHNKSESEKCDICQFFKRLHKDTLDAKWEKESSLTKGYNIMSVYFMQNILKSYFKQTSNPELTKGLENLSRIIKDE